MVELLNPKIIGKNSKESKANTGKNTSISLDSKMEIKSSLKFAKK